MKTQRAHSEHGFSIIEMLVTMVIVGVAIAGLTEVLWINGLFSMRQFNKVDNIAGANHFLELLGKDVRVAVGIGSRIAPSSDSFNGIELSNNALIIQVPHISPAHTAAQFPVLAPLTARQQYDTIVYQVINSGNSTQSITRTSYPDPSVRGTAVGPTTVLNGVLGPMNGSILEVFDYVQDSGAIVPASNFPFQGPNFTLMNSVTSIVVNLDLQCTNSSNATLQNNSATLGIRRQYFMRNRLSLSN